MRQIKTLTSGYSVSISNIEDRPSLQEYPLGSFVEDYVFDNSGDLDVHNGRFEINAEGVHSNFAAREKLSEALRASCNLQKRVVGTTC